MFNLLFPAIAGLRESGFTPWFAFGLKRLAAFVGTMRRSSMCKVVRLIMWKSLKSRRIGLKHIRNACLRLLVVFVSCLHLGILALKIFTLSEFFCPKCFFQKQKFVSLPPKRCDISAAFPCRGFFWFAFCGSCRSFSQIRRIISRIDGDLDKIKPRLWSGFRYS